MGKLELSIEGLLNVNEARKALGNIGYATLYRWIAKGHIAPVKIAGQNFFPVSEIERLQKEKAQTN